MVRHEKTLESLLHGKSDANVAFNDLRGLLIFLGFEERIRGSHHIFTRSNMVEIINIQPIGTMAKAYQVKQIRNLILKYELWRGGE